MVMEPLSTKRIAFIGNYLPRQCGIATFTTDLCEAVAAEFSEVDCFAVPANDIEKGYAYPPRVRFEFSERNLDTYRRAADYLNIHNVDVVCLQHEYGIFGGLSGSHILALLQELRMPVVTTLHTILREPDEHQRKAMEELARISDRLVVMSQRGAAFLQEIYRIPEEKIDFIPHGIPDVPFVDPNFYKDQFDVAGKIVILTFGLLSQNKGIEYVIEALPEVVKRYPDLVYIVLGATHPHVIKTEGETYRLSLQRLAQEKGVEDHVRFYNRFVSLEELVEFIGMADLYITPYLNRAQISSGTLAYTVGAGKAVVSTPYWYAEELLAEDRGVLVPFRDGDAIADRIVALLGDGPTRHAMRRRAYMFGREMVWKNVAHRYMESFAKAREMRQRYPRPAGKAKGQDRQARDLPPVKLDHLKRLTDTTGILQHAVFTVPNYREGYTTGDNARALVATVLLEDAEQVQPEEVHGLASTYMAFLWYALDLETGRFHNALGYERRWVRGQDTEDAHGQAIWALGTVLGHSGREGLKNIAGRLFEVALKQAPTFASPRAWAFTLIGIQEYMRRFYGDREAQQVREDLSERLLNLYRQHSAEGWPWFEEAVTHTSATLPHALMMCGRWMGREDMMEAGLRALKWLAALQTSPYGHFAPIGTDGYFSRGGEPARFDQRPVEAQAMVSACLEAYRMTDEDHWLDDAQRAFEWFLGRNDLQSPLYDPSTGGCRDGLHADRVNQNMGAESTLCLLLSLLEMRLSRHMIQKP